MNKTERGAIYARVSTLDQHPENQLHELREFAKRNGISIYKEYIDHASGADETRPGLNDLLIDARRNRFDIVLIWKLDRLGRSLQHLIQLSQEFKQLNIELKSSTQDIDTTTPMGKYFYQNMGALAELERELIRERIFLGLDRAKREGKHCGRPQGSKDKHPRKKSGYYNRWMREGKKPSQLKRIKSLPENRP